MPLPSPTFQLHGTYLLTRMMHGDAVFSFNPFFLYNLSEGKYFVPYGKEVTNTQANKIIKAKLEQKNIEENYNPRECRIPSNPRPSFKHVEL